MSPTIFHLSKCLRQPRRTGPALKMFTLTRQTVDRTNWGNRDNLPVHLWGVLTESCFVFRWSSRDSRQKFSPAPFTLNFSIELNWHLKAFLLHLCLPGLCSWPHSSPRSGVLPVASEKRPATLFDPVHQQQQLVDALYKTKRSSIATSLDYAKVGQLLLISATD